MGEVVKYGLIDDPELWHLLESIDGSVHSILENSETIIYRSCNVKRKIVVEDEFEGGVRMYLNLVIRLGMPLNKQLVTVKSCTVKRWLSEWFRFHVLLRKKVLMPKGIHVKLLRCVLSLACQ